MCNIHYLYWGDNYGSIILNEALIYEILSVVEKIPQRESSDL